MIIKIAKLIYIFFIGALAVQASYLTYSLYYFWKSNSLSQYYLPPHQSINYFLQYSFFHFWSHFLAALIFSLVILFSANYFNKKRGEKHFWPEEPYFIAIAILLVGYPGWLIYFALILLVPVLWSFLIAIWRWLKMFFELGIRNDELGGDYFPRISYYYFWLSLAVGAILINKWLATFNWWLKLII